MSTAADRLVSAVVKKVKDSGLLESGKLMATVSAIATDGTLTATRGSDTYPKVRILSAYLKPAVGDTVEIMRTLGGWVCIGSFRSASHPRIQSGTVNVTPSTDNQWSSDVHVNFPSAFASAPRVVATPNSALPSSGGTGVIEWGISGVTASGFDIRLRKTISSTSVMSWIATDL